MNMIGNYVYGIIFGVTSSILFSLNSLVTRRGVYYGNVFEAVSMTVVLGIPIFLLAVLFRHELYDIYLISFRILIIFILVGILHFLVGRYLLYSSIHYIGAASSTPVVATTQVFAILMAIPLLKETLNLLKVIGIAFSISGIILLVYSHIRNRIMKRGIFLALSATFIFATTTILIRYGLGIYPRPIIAVLISYLAASTIFIHPSGRKSRELYSKLPYKTLIYIILAAIFVDLGQLFRYEALNNIEVSVLAPIMATIPIQVIVYSYLVNREYEEINRWNIMAALIVTLGVILVVYSGI